MPGVFKAGSSSASTMNRKKALLSGSVLFPALLIAGFTLLALVGMLFDFDGGNSGRYVLSVLQAADPELFVGDVVVASLARFNTPIGARRHK